MESSPLVSVVVPLYNKEHTISASLTSILKQAYKKFEVVVVDDGSTDKGLSIVRSLLDTRIRSISQRNCGQSAARNVGIRHSNGSLVVFLDADDLWDEGHIATLVRLSTKYPETGLVATAYRSIYRHGYAHELKLSLGNGTDCSLQSSDYFRLASIAPFIWVSAVGVPAWVFTKLGQFLVGEHRGADREMWARIALNYPVAYGSEVSATYNCEAPGRESNKARNLQPPPALILLDKEITKLDTRVSEDSLRTYRNSLLFGYLGKLLIDADYKCIEETLKRTHPIGFLENYRYFCWRCVLFIPRQVSIIILRLGSSRYTGLLRKLAYQRGGVLISRVYPKEKENNKNWD